MERALPFDIYSELTHDDQDNTVATIQTTTNQPGPQSGKALWHYHPSHANSSHSNQELWATVATRTVRLVRDVAGVIDDREPNINAAREIGMVTYLFRGIHELHPALQTQLTQ